MRRRNRNAWLLVAGLGVSSALLADEPGADAPPVIRVLLAAALDTTLSGQMNGTLATLDVTLGQSVTKGATLASFNCSEANAKAKVATAELAMAKQNHDAKRNLRALNAVGDLEVAVAATEVQKADGALSLSQAQRSYCQVQAPFAGRVAKVYVKPYQTLAAGTPLVDLVSDGALKVRLNVPSSLLPRLRQGMALDVAISETGKHYAATVTAINARVDAVAQTVELEARLDAVHPELIAGMSGTASVANDHD
jgi:RND family efflux transporter MFP subunit